MSLFPVQGSGTTTLFCGDDINDLTALSPADVHEGDFSTSKGDCLNAGLGQHDLCVDRIENITAVCRAWATQPCSVAMASMI